MRYGCNGRPKTIRLCRKCLEELVTLDRLGGLHSLIVARDSSLRAAARPAKAGGARSQPLKLPDVPQKRALADRR